MYARDNLLQQGYDVFCPFERIKRRIQVGTFDGYRIRVRGEKVTPKFRLVDVDEPVFLNYLFVDSVYVEGASAVRQTPGVLCLVTTVGSPMTVPDKVIERLRGLADDRGMVSAKDLSKPFIYFDGKIGEQFRFGPDSTFVGMIGEITSLARTDETGKIHALVDLLGGRVRTHVDVKDVDRAISDPRVALAPAA